MHNYTSETAFERSLCRVIIPFIYIASNFQRNLYHSLSQAPAQFVPVLNAALAWLFIQHKTLRAQVVYFETCFERSLCLLFYRSQHLYIYII